MAVKTSCPEPDQIRQFLLGQVPPLQVESLERHLRQCGRCQQLVEVLKSDDTLVRIVSEEPQAAGSGTRLGTKGKPAADPTLGPPPADSETNPGRPPSRSDLQAKAAPAAPAGADMKFDFLAPPQTADELGRLGDYRVLKVIGKGGMGVVFLAEDVHLQRSVALKVILPEIAQKPAARERFLREARASAKIEHDNIVAIYQVSEDRGVPFMAMPLLKGSSLEDFLRQRARKQPGAPLDLKEILKIGRETARGLAAAHERGLIHRDIKPANLWLDASAGGRVKILDFGLARPAAEEGHLTQAGTIVGTPSYMAPEQAQGYKVDSRADLFSLGVVLYRLCTGTLPFTGANALDILMALAVHKPSPPNTINLNLPQELSDLVMKLLEKAPNQRLGSAQEVVKTIQAMEKVLRGGVSMPELARIGPSGSQPFPIPLPPPPPDGGEPTLMAAPRVAPPRAKPQRGMLLVAILLFVLIGGAVYLGLSIFAGKDKGKGSPAPGKETKAESSLTNSIGMKLVRIPAGKLVMGSPATEAGRNIDEDPHEVAITRPFMMGVHEVTVGQYKAFVKDSGYRTEAETDGGAFRLGEGGVWTRDGRVYWQTPGFDQTDDHPVVCVSWNDAITFCDWLSKKEGKKYALPTEAQWEYACRANSQGPYCFGDDVKELDPYAWFGINSGMKPQKVGQKKPNAWGLHDMHGNAWEWTADWFAFYQNGAQEDPPGPTSGVCRVARGGSWFNAPQHVRSAVRKSRNLPSDRDTNIGFRVVREADDAGPAPPTPVPIPAPKWTPLFNNKNLAGWSIAGGGHGSWKVVNGTLTCTGQNGNLFSDRDFDNFHLRIEAKINGGNSGLFFRTIPKPTGPLEGYKVQINNTPGDSQKTGGLQALAPVTDNLVPPDVWFIMEVIAQGKRVRILVNGKQVVDYTETGNRRPKGRLGLQQPNNKTAVFFGKIEIRELGP